MKKQYIIASVVMIGLVSAAGATAFTVDTHGSANTQVEIKDIQTSTNANVEVKTETNTNTGDNGADNRLLPTVNKKTTAKITVRGWDAEKKEEIEGKIAAAIENNPQITSTEVAEDSVTVHYSAPAKLFGFIPFNMNIVLQTNAEGHIIAHFPWYKFMATSPFSNVAENMNEIFQHNQTDLEFVKAKGNVDGQVQTLSKVSAALKAQYDLALQKK